MTFRPYPGSFSKSNHIMFFLLNERKKESFFYYIIHFIILLVGLNNIMFFSIDFEKDLEQGRNVFDSTL